MPPVGNLDGTQNRKIDLSREFFVTLFGCRSFQTLDVYWGVHRYKIPIRTVLLRDALKTELDLSSHGNSKA